MYSFAYLNNLFPQSFGPTESGANYVVPHLPEAFPLVPFSQAAFTTGAEMAFAVLGFHSPQQNQGEGEGEKREKRDTFLQAREVLGRTYGQPGCIHCGQGNGRAHLPALGAKGQGHQ